MQRPNRQLVVPLNKYRLGMIPSPQPYPHQTLKILRHICDVATKPLRSAPQWIFNTRTLIPKLAYCSLLLKYYSMLACWCLPEPLSGSYYSRATLNRELN